MSSAVLNDIRIDGLNTRTTTKLIYKLEYNNLLFHFILYKQTLE